MWFFKWIDSSEALFLINTTYPFFWKVVSLFLLMDIPGIEKTIIPEGHSFYGSSLYVEPDTVTCGLNTFPSPVKVKVILTRITFAFHHHCHHMISCNTFEFCYNGLENLASYCLCHVYQFFQDRWNFLCNKWWLSKYYE